MARLGLKIDVDTLAGMREGVPALLEILGERKIQASFFMALGPDNSGRAILRVFRQEGFLEKMFRTRAPAVYGLKTMLYGTLLPAPIISEAASDILPRVVNEGHEVGMHGYDHVLWHDSLVKMSREDVKNEVSRAQEVMIGIVGYPVRSFAAPGWQTSAASRAVLAKSGFLYASDTRGESPYWPCFGAEVSDLLEIPTTLPTLDELLGFNSCGPEEFFQLIYSRLNDYQPQVLTAHAEVEGGPYAKEFTHFLDLCLARGVEFFRLGDWASELLKHPQDIPVADVYQGRLSGRAGRVSRQGGIKGSA